MLTNAKYGDSEDNTIHTVVMAFAWHQNTVPSWFLNTICSNYNVIEKSKVSNMR